MLLAAADRAPACAGARSGGARAAGETTLHGRVQAASAGQEQAALCTEPGEMGELLRREGLYSSLLSKWREARRRGSLTALAPRPRGPKPALADPRDRRIAELEREKVRLQHRLRQAELIIEVQRKASELLGITLSQPGSGDVDS